ncbi:MAG: hypothetical protein M3444_18945 [Acidobacteriota bacterium]|nr:hypothetical protein [Acidobacteriota bacterium]
MTVALRQSAMLLSELAIIYLAAAAPFGVRHFLGLRARDRRHAPEGLSAGDKRRVREAAKAAAAALVWPLTALLLLSRRAAARDACANATDEDSTPDERKVERARRATVGALLAVEDALAERGPIDEAERHALFAARECVERYAGLALACAGARADDAPTTRELELCRIAGRSGDDLLAAGRCVHRRNVTRLLAHLERARSELVHALADVRELAHKSDPSPRSSNSAKRAGDGGMKQIPDSEQTSDALHSEQTSEALRSGRASEALLRALARTIEMLSLFDDHATIVSVARLLEAERARLRRLEAERECACRLEGGDTHAARAAREGGETCTTRVAPTAFATPRLPTPTSRRG